MRFVRFCRGPQRSEHEREPACRFQRRDRICQAFSNRVGIGATRLILSVSAPQHCCYDQNQHLHCEIHHATPAFICLILRVCGSIMAGRTNTYTPARDKSRKHEGTNCTNENPSQGYFVRCSARIFTTTWSAWHASRAMCSCGAATCWRCCFAGGSCTTGRFQVKPIITRAASTF